MAKTVFLIIITIYIITVALEYYWIWKQGQKKLKEIDSAALVRALKQRQES